CRAPLQRNPCLDGEATSTATTRLELAVVQRNALAHADEPVTASVLGPCRSAGATSGVADLELERLGGVADQHARVGRSCMLDRVREAFLDHAVGGEIDAGRQRRALALDPNLDRKTGGAGTSDEFVELLHTRLVCVGGRLAPA